MLTNVNSPEPWCVFGVSSMCVVSSDMNLEFKCVL